MERKTGFEPATLTLANRWSSMYIEVMTSIYAGQDQREVSVPLPSVPLNTSDLRSKWHESGTTPQAGNRCHAALPAATLAGGRHCQQT